MFPDTFVRRPNPGLSGGASRLGPRSATPSVPNGGQQICPTDPNKPLVEPEALSIIHADQAQSLATGQGVKVAFVAEGIDTSNPDFIRPDGSHVFVDYQDFSGDGPNAPTSGAEAFGDASSIAAQGTVKHDLSRYVNPAHPLPAGCNVVIRGVSPGASLVGIKVFGQAAGAFTSVILQGLDWAVSHDHVDVLNESFGSDPLPDTSQDVIKQFNRLAVADDRGLGAVPRARRSVGPTRSAIAGAGHSRRPIAGGARGGSGSTRSAPPVQRPAVLHRRRRTSATSAARVGAAAGRGTAPSPRSRPRSPTARTRARADGRLVDPTQLDLATPAGSATGADVTVTNDGSSSESYKAKLRTLTNQICAPAGQRHAQPDGRPDVHQRARRRRRRTRRSRSTSRRASTGSTRRSPSPGPANTVNLTLFDPSKKFTAFTYQPPGGFFDYDHISVRNPTPGTWTAAFSTPADSTGFSGAVKYDFTDSQFGSVGNVSPSSFTLAPGASRSVHVSMGAPAPGDYTRDLQLSGSSGKTTVVPVVLRSLVPLGGGGGSFSGTITGGNGNGFIGREDTFAFDVPRGAPAVNVSLRLPNDPNTQLLGFLVSPDGQAIGQQASVQHNSGASTMDIFRHAPQPGRWTFVIATLNPVGGTTTAARFTGTVSLTQPPVSSTGVPSSSRTVIPKGGQVTAKVRITNPGRTDMNVFVDPRRSERTFYSLLSLGQATGADAAALR